MHSYVIFYTDTHTFALNEYFKLFKQLNPVGSERMKANHIAQYQSLVQTLYHVAFNYNAMYLEIIRNFPGKIVFLKIQTM